MQPPIEQIPAKHIVTRTNDPNWFGMDYNMNLYRGCCHGCIYCDSRSSCYRIENFDQVRVKENALAIVRDDLASLIEPGAPPSSKRMELIAALREQGIFTGILLMPVLPFLEDQKEDILRLVSMAHEAGASFIYPAFGMTLRDNQREWYLDRLEELFPGQGLKSRYLKTYKNAYRCTSPRAKTLWDAFAKACEGRRILYKMSDIIPAYKRGYGYTQLSLF